MSNIYFQGGQNFFEGVSPPMRSLVTDLPPRRVVWHFTILLSSDIHI